jgi:two-component system osmolarity sensor histidine kinase EnvZ
MKLALAMMDDSKEITDLSADIAEMEHMLDDYLAFARGEGGEESEVTDLAELVRDTVAAATKAQGSQDAVVAAPDHLMLSVKRVALRRCIANLVDNALKHGHHVAVSLIAGDRRARIVIEDDGPGIAPARREEAFRPFHRLDEGRNLQTGGSGLGLAIARGIARAHGGDIVLDESTMGGLKATISLPL